MVSTQNQHTSMASFDRLLTASCFVLLRASSSCRSRKSKTKLKGLVPMLLIRTLDRILFNNIPVISIIVSLFKQANTQRTRRSRRSRRMMMDSADDDDKSVTLSQSIDVSAINIDSDVDVDDEEQEDGNNAIDIDSVSVSENNANANDNDNNSDNVVVFGHNHEDEPNTTIISDAAETLTSLMKIEIGDLWEDRYPGLDYFLFNSEYRSLFEYFYDDFHTYVNEENFSLRRPTVRILLKLLQNPNVTTIHGGFLSGLLFRRSILKDPDENIFDDWEINAIQQACRANTRITSLENLRMECSPRRKQDCEEFWSAMGQLPTLNSISVTYFRRPSDFDEIVDDDEQPRYWPEAHTINTICYKSLQSLIVSSSSMNQHGGTTISTRNVKELAVAHCDKVFEWNTDNDETPLVVDIDVLVSIMKSVSNTCEILCLRNMFYSDQVLDKKLSDCIMTQMSQLSTLQISSRVHQRLMPGYVPVPTKTFYLSSSVGRSTVTKLTALQIDGVRIDDTRAFDLLIKNNHHLSKLILVDSEFVLNGFSGISGSGLEKLGKTITSHPHMTDLILHLPFVPNEWQRRMFCRSVAEGLRINTKLRYIEHVSTVGDFNSHTSGGDGGASGTGIASKMEIMNAIYDNSFLHKISLPFYEGTTLSLEEFHQLSSILKRGSATSALRSVRLAFQDEIPKNATTILKHALEDTKCCIEAFHFLSRYVLIKYDREKITHSFTLAINSAQNSSFVHFLICLIRSSDENQEGMIEIPGAAKLNPHLKEIRLFHGMTKNYVYADVIGMLHNLAGNYTLERLIVGTLRCSCCSVTTKITCPNQRNAVYTAVSKLFALSTLDIDCFDDECNRQIRPLLLLNKNGRKYMIEQNGTKNSKENGIDVLASVNDDIDCLFIHLRENLGTFFCSSSSPSSATATYTCNNGRGIVSESEGRHVDDIMHSNNNSSNSRSRMSPRSASSTTVAVAAPIPAVASGSSITNTAKTSTSKRCLSKIVEKRSEDDEEQVIGYYKGEIAGAATSTFAINNNNYDITKTEKSAKHPRL